VQPAILRLVDATGQELNSLTLERPMAKVLKVQLVRGAPPTYQVTVDLDAGFGSYSGPLTQFAEVRDGKLAWVMVAQDSGEPRALAVMSSLKTAWKFVGAPGQRQILSVACRPDFDNSPPDGPMTFNISFRRFAYEDSRWRMHVRTVPGCWENDEPFPPRTSFP
jgi:hypothetical protein